MGSSLSSESGERIAALQQTESNRSERRNERAREHRQRLLAAAVADRDVQGDERRGLWRGVDPDDGQRLPAGLAVHFQVARRTEAIAGVEAEIRRHAYKLAGDPTGPSVAAQSGRRASSGGKRRHRARARANPGR